MSGKEKDEEALPSGVLSSSCRSSPAAADVGEGGVRDEEDVAADKLPSEQRKTRKRRKNGRQTHHFRKRRQAEHFLYLKTEKGRDHLCVGRCGEKRRKTIVDTASVWRTRGRRGGGNA